jgi:L-lactate dehydrogenase complex protein LldG
MSAREEILSTIRARRRKTAAVHPGRYVVPPLPDERVRVFAKRAGLANAVVREIASLGDVPRAVAELLRERNMEAAVHLPPDPAMDRLDWQSTPGLERRTAPPGPDGAALNFAPFAIAETGTLVYAASPERPASWHFRPGFEIAVLRASNVENRLEDVLGRLKAIGALPHTVNLVTGPSRTGDIEQTLELGAHGPKQLAILIVRD